MEALEAEVTSDAAKEWKKNNCKDAVYVIELNEEKFLLTNTMPLSKIHIFLK